MVASLMWLLGQSTCAHQLARSAATSLAERERRPANLIAHKYILRLARVLVAVRFHLVGIEPEIVHPGEVVAFAAGEILAQREQAVVVDDLLTFEALGPGAKEPGAPRVGPAF